MTFVKSPLASVLTDANGYAVDATNPIAVNPAESGAANFATGQASITGSAGQIVAARATRRAVAIKNADAANILYVGGASVTTGNGHRIDPKETLTLPVIGAVYGIGSGSLTATYVEIYD